MTVLVSRTGKFWPVALAATLVLGVLIVGTVVLMQQDDAASVWREEQLVENGIQARMQEVAASVVPQVVWDDAVINLDNRYDPDWAKDNIGTFLNSVGGFAVSFVLDREGRPVFASQNGEVVSTDRFAAFAGDVAPLLAEVRAAETARVSATKSAASGVALTDPIQATEMARIGGQPTVLVASLVQPDFGKARSSGARAPIVVTAMPLDDSFLGAFGNRYLLADLRLLGDTASIAASDARVSLSNARGDTVGTLAWKPALSGQAVRTLVGVPLFAFVAALLAAALYLYWRNVSATRELMSNQGDLEQSLKELVAARDEARAASIAKSQFLASMSHEIRTPLNGILGMAQALSDSTREADTHEKLQVLTASGETLMTILNDLLDMSKIEAGKLEIAPIDQDLMAPFRMIEQLFRPMAETKGLAFRFDSRTGMSRVRIDPTRLSQCVANLVSNAIKFTAAGEISVALETRQRDGRQVEIIVSVRDTGAGISPEVLSRMFTPFTQADASTTRSFGGTGLGLVITRRLARLMGGDVVVESSPGAGSLFTLTIMAEEVDPNANGELETAGVRAETPPTNAAPVREGAVVLIVDDQPINRQVAKLFLVELRLEILEAANGQEALDILAEKRVDLVLLDAHMPVMDGRVCIQRIRSSSQPWSKLPVVALTAEAMAGDREAFIALGMTDYLSKPVNRKVLLATVSGLLASGVVGRASSPTSEPGIHEGDSLCAGELDALFAQIDIAAA